MTTANELKPCGCGGNPVVLEVTVPEAINPRWSTICVLCGITTMAFDTQERAKEWWNKAMALSAPPAVAPQGWQPIETAPKMKNILLFAVTDIREDGSVGNWKMATGFWHTTFEDDATPEYSPWNWEGHQLKTYEIQPTHWMALPTAPEKSNG